MAIFAFERDDRFIWCRLGFVIHHYSSTISGTGHTCKQLYLRFGTKRYEFITLNEHKSGEAILSSAYHFVARPK